jgi:large subunit ribosomal protein L6
MSRVAKTPVVVPSGVNVTLNGQEISVKGSKGQLNWVIHPAVQVRHEEGILHVGVATDNKDNWTCAGTTRALINNMVVGVSEGFQKKLTLIGVGYRAQAKGSVLNLNLGFSHPIDFPVPEGIDISTPSQTEIVVAGVDKQRVGQVAAEIRAFRPPEPYKGKGVRYVDEQVIRKAAKKK